jgi:hypothetical protein
MGSAYRYERMSDFWVEGAILLFLSSSLSSVVTVVNLSRSNIHNAASDDAFCGSAAFSAKSVSSASPKSPFVMGRDLFFPERKSDRTQKNVTV